MTRNSSEKKRLLIYAHYYVPDVASTGQILKELAEGLLDQFAVTVICTVPSYGGQIQEKYKKRWLYRENINGVKVLRIRVPEFTKSNKLSRVKNILVYFFGAMLATFLSGRQDFVFSISQPPVLGGLLGVWGKWMKHAGYIYNIQDYNPEQTISVGYCRKKWLLGAMLWFDKFSCRHSDLVITVGRDLVETMHKRFKGKNVPQTMLINNWIDEKEIYPLPAEHEKVLAFKRTYGLENKFVIMYSGNIGLYYDLEHLIKVIKKFRRGYTLDGRWLEGPRTPDGREVVFAFVGAGSVLDQLMDYTKRHHFENVVFIPYQNKEDLNYSLNAADVHWCVNAKGIKGVSVPSKAYGIMAAGKPILGVLEKGTEINSLIEDTGCGRCCQPGEYEEVEKEIGWFIQHADSEVLRQMGQNGRDYLVTHLTRDKSVRKYADAILQSRTKKAENRDSATTEAWTGVKAEAEPTVAEARGKADTEAKVKARLKGLKPSQEEAETFQEI